MDEKVYTNNCKTNLRTVKRCRTDELQIVHQRDWYLQPAHDSYCPDIVLAAEETVQESPPQFTSMLHACYIFWYLRYIYSNMLYINID